ncbi:MAG TPA: PfkB family carbohydrate kinase [Ktedonobacteraceae bacterium]
MQQLARPRRLVLVGSVLVDILMYVDRLPERGGDTIARQTLLTSGGGFNVLIGAMRLGLPASYAGRVGNGPMGAQVMAALTMANIPLLLPRVRGEDTGFDVGLAEASAEHTFVTAPGCESRLSLHDLQSILLQPGDAIYVSGYELVYPVSGASLETWLPELAQEHLLVIDPGPLVLEIPDKRLASVLARTNILSLNARELGLLTGLADLATATRSLAAYLAPGGFVVARMGEQGCWLASTTLEPLHLPTRPAHVVDTTGAGDAHVAALLARLAMGDEIQTATYVANIAASLAIEHLGPATCPTAQELQAALQSATDQPR